MGQYLSAGVYVKETDLSQIIPSVASSIGAIVGNSKKGPVDKAYLITNTKEFVDRYGTPDPAISWMHYQALAFLVESNALYVKRTAGTGATYSGMLLTKPSAGAVSITSGLAQADPTSINFTTAGGYTAQENLAYIYAEGPGSYGGQIALSILSQNIATPSAPTLQQAGTGGTLTAATYSYRVSAFNSLGESLASVAQTIVVAGGTTNAITVNWAAISNASGYKVYGRVGSSEFLMYTAGSTEVSFVDTGAITSAGFVAANYTIAAPVIGLSTTATTGGSIVAGTYSHKVTAITSAGESIASQTVTTVVPAGTATNTIVLNWSTVSGATGYKIYGRTAGSEKYIATVGAVLTYTDLGAITPTFVAPNANGNTPVFTLSVFDTTVSTVVPVERWDLSLANNTDAFGQQTEIETQLNNFSKYVRAVSNYSALTTVPLVYSSTFTYMAAGNSGTAPTSSQIALDWSNTFSDPEAITVKLLINGGYSDPIVQLAMDTVAQTRGDAVAILDVPSVSQAVSAALDYRNITLNLNSNRSALYTPDVYIQDNYNNKLLYVPPAGHVAAIYARTDRVAYPWMAPAGLNRALLSVLGVRQIYNQGKRDMLAPAQINYLRNFPGEGIAVWEQKTLQSKSSALSYVNVRRLMDVISVSTSKALKYSNFEPNDSFLQDSIGGAINEYLALIKAARGLIQYLVVCDASNNPPAITGKGELHVDLYLTPTLPAEKIQLQLVVTRQGATLSELAKGGGNF